MCTLSVFFAAIMYAGFLTMEMCQRMSEEEDNVAILGRAGNFSSRWRKEEEEAIV